MGKNSDVKHICVVSDAYPTDQSPVFTFVAQLCNAMADLGVKVSVIAPQSIVKVLMNRAVKHPLKRKDKRALTDVSIYQPWCLSFGSRFMKLNNFFRKRAIERVVAKEKLSPDVYYAHFWHSGYFIYNVAKRQKKPLIVATGESEISFNADNSDKRDFCNYVKKVICVSSKNRDESVSKELTQPQKCEVIPNAIDENLFKLLDKKKCRQELGLPLNAFILISVGWFNHRKGIKRVSAAINKIQDGNIYSVFLGEGEEGPTCDNILYKGRVPYNKIPLYLNASDVFVLPTLHEGCCNAVIEAMACGLPIISSDLPFNHDVLNKDNSILVVPEDISMIAESVSKLYNDQKERARLASNALLTAKSLTINVRARKILDYLSA